jgi:hemerythrin-like domain-containing protein
MSKQENALRLLKRDHREVEALLSRCIDSGDRGDEREQSDRARELVRALSLHTELEEEIFYPYVRECTGRLDLIEEAHVEHAAVDALLKDLGQRDDGVHRRAVLNVLAGYLRHHIREEERKIFPAIEETGVDLTALGQELMEQRERRSGHAGSEGNGRDDASRGDSRRRGSGTNAAAASDASDADEHHGPLSNPTQRAK